MGRPRFKKTGNYSAPQECASFVLHDAHSCRMFNRYKNKKMQLARLSGGSQSLNVKTIPQGCQGENAFDQYVWKILFFRKPVCGRRALGKVLTGLTGARYFATT
jgi:hypothetical protein